MFCKECGLKHPAFTNYCTTTGEDLRSLIPTHVSHRAEGFCGNCGKNIEPSSQYCSHCGETHSLAGFHVSHDAPKTKGQNYSAELTKMVPDILSKRSFVPILTAVALTILLSLLTAFIIKSQVEQFIVEDSFGEITASDIEYMDDIISDGLAEETGLEIDFPNVYNLFTYVSLIHTVDFEFSGEVIGNGEGEYVQGDFEFIAKNLSMSSLFIVVLVLIFGGLILGSFAKKNGLSLKESILKFSVIYGLFVMLSSAVAGFHFNERIEVLYSTVDIAITGVFPLIESFFVGTLLAASISGLAALLVIHGKDAFSFIHKQAVYVQYIIYSVGITLIGTSLFTAIFFGTSNNVYDDGAIFMYESSEKLMAGPQGLWTWNLSHFIPLNFRGLESGDGEFFSLQLFSSFQKLSELDDFYTLSFIKEMFFIEAGLPLILKASFLVPASLLVFSGYNLYKVHALKVVELLKFSAIYGVVMLCTRLFSNFELAVKVRGEDLWELGTFLLRIQPNVVPVFIISSLFALICISAGGYLNKFLGGSVR